MEVIKNLDGALASAYRRHVALDRDEFTEYYAVFHEVFNRLQELMKTVDPYYRKYNSRKEFTGSHSDRLRISRPNEFDVDIVVKTPPLVRDNLAVELAKPSYVRLRLASELCSRHDRAADRVIWRWVDGEGYLLRTLFSDWFKGVVTRALDTLPIGVHDQPYMVVRGVCYRLSVRDHWPACTLIVQADGDFHLDVDLVPALEFPEHRWPHLDHHYRLILARCRAVRRIPYWLVVPKGERGAGAGPRHSPCSWRVSRHAQEKLLMSDRQHLRQIIRLIKKVRDTQKLKMIASYYIKTLFLWELLHRGEKFWYKSESVIFKTMVRKLYEAVRDRQILFFWNPKYNLIGHVHSRVLHSYEVRLKKLVDALEQSPLQLEKVIRCLLSPSEYRENIHLFM